MKIRTRANKKNIETIEVINALREGGEAPHSCPPGEHQMMPVLSGSNDTMKVTMKMCAVCGEFEWD